MIEAEAKNISTVLVDAQSTSQWKSWTFCHAILQYQQKLFSGKSDMLFRHREKKDSLWPSTLKQFPQNHYSHVTPA